MTNKSKTLYVGVTNNIRRRIEEHRCGLTKGFTARYNIKKLVYYEEHDAPRDSIVREKQIKGWLRKKKIALIESLNPEWKDLAETLR
jgi:putative endonuclease